MKKIKAVIIVVLCLLTFVSRDILAISQISAPIIIKNVLRGSQVDQKFMVLNNGDEEVTYQLQVVGDISDWITLYDINAPDLVIDQIAIPAKSNAYAGIRFNIPDDAPNGEYRSVVDIIEKLKKDSSAENSLGVNLKLSRGIQVIVSDEEIVDFSATIVPESYNLGKNDPLVFRVKYRNNGNIKIAPQLQVKIKRDDAIVHNVILPYPENEPWVGALSAYEIAKNEVPLSLPGGSYQAKIDILYDNQVMDTQSFGFVVGSSGLAGIIKGISDVRLGFLWWIMGIIAIITVVILVINGVGKLAKKRE